MLKAPRLELYGMEIVTNVINQQPAYVDNTTVKIQFYLSAMKQRAAVTTIVHVFTVFRLGTHYHTCFRVECINETRN